MNDIELRAILELKSIHGLGDVGLRRLLRKHVTAAGALEAIRSDPRAGAARRAPQGRIERALDFFEASGITVLLESEPRYPARLRNLKDPPPVLFCAGDVSLVTMPSVAVVGSRRHTEYGATATEMVVAGLSRAGAVIVSGLARGIDRIAHETALYAGGRTIAVLGCGLDVAYPREHLALQEAIGRSGLVLSEFLPGEPPVRHNFPKRNRVLAALAHALVVIEAGPKSGALITVDHALDLGLDVFAVPGPIGRTTSGGTNELIRDGASLIESPAPVLEAIFGPRAAGAMGEHPASGVPAPSGADSRAGGRAAAAPESSSDPVRGALLAVLGPISIHVDDAARRANVSATDALVRLLELELEGEVRQLPGMRFARRGAPIPESRNA